MQFTLIDYQERAARDILKRLDRAAADFDDDGDRSAVVLSAPTGAGKTVIATAVVESLLHGSDLGEPNQQATILWVTDDPSLNEQTRRKMEAASDVNLQMEVIHSSKHFDQETLDAGKLYFVNIQSFAKSNSLVKAGNSRQHTLWETIENTIRARGRNFLVFIDEAHKGTGTEKTDQTIVQKIIGGANPVPIVVGISATSGKFTAAVENGKSGQRTIRHVDVPVEDVQKSGLVKDRIVLYSPDDDEHELAADTTLIRHAVRRIREYETRWAAYTQSQGEPTVVPALIIQVNDGITDADLRDVYDAVVAEWPVIGPDSFVNTFAEHAVRTLPGGIAIRYEQPHLIHDNQQIRVIIAKNAVTTGWDCPRAEVLVSLRTAHDATYIAQLIGRIVRQPLARRIEADTFLNEVYAVLPNFDNDEVDKVAALFDPEKSENGTGSQVVRASVQFTRAPGADDIIRSLTELPSYTIPGASVVSQVTRLHKLAGEFAKEPNPWILNPLATANKHLHVALDGQATLLGDTLAEREGKIAQVRVHSSVFDTAGNLIDRVDHGTDDADQNNVTDMRRKADRTLKGDLATSYWNYRLDTVGDDQIHEEEIRAAALGTLPDVAAAVDKAAGDLVEAWLTQFGKKISEVGDARGAEYARIQGQAARPELTSAVGPNTVSIGITGEAGEDSDDIEARIAADTANRWDKHVLVDPADGLFWFGATTSWERHVLETELADSAAWWYRNPSSGRQSLTIPWNDGNRTRGLHPDFIIWDEQGRVSIVDPHGQNNSDSIGKLRGYLDYLDTHPDVYHRVNPIIVIGDTYWALALQNAGTRAAVRGALDAGQTVEQVYVAHGVTY